MGGLGTKPQQGSRGPSPQWRARGAKPPEAESSVAFEDSFLQFI